MNHPPLPFSFLFTGRKARWLELARLLGTMREVCNGGPYSREHSSGLLTPCWPRATHLGFYTKENANSS